jgi:HK97 family phage prohead protease
MPAPAVDWPSRTITGLAVPYGTVGRSQRRRWRFELGALAYSDPVWLLLDHDHAQRLGRAVSFAENAAGLWAVLKVRMGKRGDRVLALADDGALSGLSPGIEHAELARDGGVVVVHRALLNEVSLTHRPAFETARVGGERG